jgi:DNA invertase Pin-like site-specific DNA recombinase
MRPLVGLVGGGERNRSSGGLTVDVVGQIEGPIGHFMLQQMVAAAELEAGMISNRTKDALAAAARRRTNLGGRRRKIIGRDAKGKPFAAAW